jgi:hypothetical protein
VPQFPSVLQGSPNVQERPSTNLIPSRIKMKDAVRRLGFWKGFWFMGVPWQHRGSFLVGAKRQLCLTSMTLDPIIPTSIDPIIQCTC